MLREAIANGVEYVDLEEDIAGQIPRFGKTKRIISYHNFRKTPDNLRELHARLKSLDADIVKIATMANQPHDNLRMLEMMQESDSPTVGMCMGDIGTPSRILGPKFGAPFTYATFHHERALAPGQLSYEQMVNVYRHNSIEPDDGGVRRDRRPGRPQPEPADSQRGIRRGRASTRSTCRSACRSTRWASSWRTCRGWASTG